MMDIATGLPPGSAIAQPSALLSRRPAVTVSDPSADFAALERQLAEQSGRVAELWRALQAQRADMAALDQDRRTADRQTRSENRRHAELSAKLRETEARRNAADLARKQAEAELQQLRVRHHLVLSSTVWRASAPLRRLGDRMPAWLRRLLARRRRIAPALAPAPAAPLLPSTDGATATPAADANRRPSALLRAADPAWIAPPERPAFRQLGDMVPRGRIAVVAHVYYPELWPEIADAVRLIPEAFDLFVTLVRGEAEALHETVARDFPFARVLTVDNHGRDIVPLLTLLQTGALSQYELVCKLHTKRSIWHEDGETWRRDLIGGVLGSGELVGDVLRAFRSDPDLGLVVADGQIYAGREMWMGNAAHLERLFQNFGIDSTAFDKSFAGGSMYWIRADLLQYLADLNLGLDDFEPEPLGADGSMAHAVERLVSLICYHAGATIKETSAVMRPEIQSYDDDTTARHVCP